MKELNVTKFGTVSGLENELEVNKFIKKLNKGGYKPKFLEDGLYYAARAVKVQDKEDEYILTIDGTKYKMDISNAGVNYPVLKKELEKLSDFERKTSKEEKISKTVENATFENINDVKDIKTALNYLKNKRKYLRNKDLIAVMYPIMAVLLTKLTIILMTSYPISLILEEALGIGLYLLLGLGVGFSACLFAIQTLYCIYDRLINLKSRKMMNHKIKVLEHRLSLLKERDYSHINNHNHIQEEVITKAYKDSVIRLMREVRGLTDTLQNDRKEKALNKLDIIINEYNSKSNDLSQGLTSNETIQTISFETLRKLGSLKQSIIHESQSSLYVYNRNEDIEQDINITLNDEEVGQSRVRKF